ncbi:beta-Ala-His dipeptidase [Planococcus alpniumensis]|uniref:beta-Ala-His dipeptidase n=1 Tax=Planococcus alpniumensis TaxID=2708345 RepID=UPI001B8CFB9F|nr:beta-Ala-His dipeptidase [Planococcus sp. MSAK28401]
MSNRLLESIEPKEVFRYFEDLTRIPRCSGKEENVVAYLISFAEQHGFDWWKDEKLNIVIKKPATKGYESRPTIILQAHTDMVCEKDKETVHDFDTDPIKIEIEEDRIIAKETTLGADDGIGVALALALLADKDAEHPNVELICTSDEERGLVGAEHFDMAMVEGDVLINLDANEEGKFVVGCAGGPVVRIEIPLERTTIVPNGMSALNIRIRGLTGGHSGEDIHRGRVNSNKLMARTLVSLSHEVNYMLGDISGGIHYNAIPRETEAVIFVNAQEKQKVIETVLSYRTTYKNEYKVTEPDMEITVQECLDGSDNLLSDLSKKRLFDFLYLCYSGIVRMDAEIAGAVESSVNLGTIHLEKETAVIQMMTRSSLESAYREMYNQIAYLAECVGGTVHIMSDCPEWEYNPSSEVKKVFHKVYQEMFGKAPEFFILHAGLECGVFAKKTNRPMDMIAAGPTSKNLHMPGEHLSISSVQNFWRFFKEVVKHI